MWSRHDAYDCRFWCFGEDREDFDRRRLFRCTLPDFDPRDWKPESPDVPAHWLGGEPSEPSYKRKPEGHEQGCPGGWARCAFVQSIRPYLRLRGSAGFSSNVLLDRTDDRLVIEATQYWELEILRAEAHFHEEIERWR